MKARKIFKKVIAVALILLLVFLIRYCWVSFPVITGYGAKVLCSAIFVAGRSEEAAKKEEVGFSPLHLANYSVNYKDSSVTCSVFGFSKRKAIFRNGLGATLLVEVDEKQVRAQQFRLAMPPVIDREQIAWPTGDRLTDSLPPSVNRQALANALEKGFAETDSNRLMRTRAIVVIFDGKLVAEKYAPGFSKDSRLTGWSMTKSLTGALTGILVKQGKLDPEAPAPVAEWADAKDPRHSITLKHLLQQSSGLDFLEDYSKYSDATRMLFMRADMGTYTATRDLKDKPGTVFSYTSGNTNLISRIIRKTVGEKDYHAFPYEALFYKLGMYSAIMEPDAAGNFVGSSYCYATARDWGRFGLFYLNNGSINGEQLLPENWVASSITPAPATKKGEYGYQLWLNRGADANGSARSYPRLPSDMFFADGFEGQNIFVVPSAKLVVVRLGLTQKGAYDVEALISDILQAIPGSK
jgi:CubicO group peptidase (beta-lactamase class C family)